MPGRSVIQANSDICAGEAVRSRLEGGTERALAGGLKPELCFLWT